MNSIELVAQEILSPIATYGLDVVAADERSHKDPAPMVPVAELADSSVNFTVRVWCDAGNYWPLKFDLTKALKQRFDAEGLSIPFPQQTVHMLGSTAAGGAGG